MGYVCCVFGVLVLFKSFNRFRLTIKAKSKVNSCPAVADRGGGRPTRVEIGRKILNKVVLIDVYLTVTWSKVLRKYYSSWCRKVIIKAWVFFLDSGFDSSSEDWDSITHQSLIHLHHLRFCLSVQFQTKANASSGVGPPDCLN